MKRKKKAEELRELIKGEGWLMPPGYSLRGGENGVILEKDGKIVEILPGRKVDLVKLIKAVNQHQTRELVRA